RILILFCEKNKTDSNGCCEQSSETQHLGGSHMHVSLTSLFSPFAKNRLRSSARLDLKALAGLALAVTASVLMSGVASAGPTPITVSLPIDTFDTSVPISTVIIKPVTTTLIDPTTTGGINYVGFQGDF